MTKPPLSQFDDIHSHSLRGPRVITSVDAAELLALPHDRGTEADNIGALLAGIAPDNESQAWYSIGYHPWNTTAGHAAADEALSVIERLAENPRVVAIGEAGLDALRGADPAEQERVFLAQAEIAERHRLPLIIHCVRRYGRLMELHRSFRPSVPWVVHGFRGKVELARQLTAAGIGVSLPAPRPDLAHLPPHLIYHDSD